jgi:hypothetical protein
MILKRIDTFALKGKYFHLLLDEKRSKFYCISPRQKYVMPVQ